MAWIDPPDPDSAPTEFGRETLRASLQRNRGQMGMYQALYTVPSVADHMTRFAEELHFGTTALPNVYKEMLATLVSTANGCQY